MYKCLKARYIGAVLVFALLSMAATCDKYAKAGELAKDVAAGVLLAQQTEITLHQQGKIDDATHQAIQEKFVAVADAGTRLDKAINIEHSAKNATAALQEAVSTLDDLSTNTLAGIKDEDTKLAVKALLLAVKTTLNNIAAFGK